MRAGHKDADGEQQRAWAWEHGQPEPWMFSVLEDYAWMKRGFLPLGPATAGHDWQWREAIDAIDAELAKLWDEERDADGDDGGTDARSETRTHNIRDELHGVKGAGGERRLPGGITGRKTRRRPRHAPKRPQE